MIPKPNNLINNLPKFDINGIGKDWTNMILKSTDLINYPILWTKDKLEDLGVTIRFTGAGAAGKNKIIKIPRLILVDGSLSIHDELIAALHDKFDLYGIIIAEIPTKPLGSLTATLLAYPPDYNSPADPTQYIAGQVLIFNLQNISVTTDGTISGLEDTEYGTGHNPSDFTFLQTVDRYTADCNTFRNTIHRNITIPNTFTSYDSNSIVFDPDKAAILAALDRYGKYTQYYIVQTDDPVDLTYDDHIKDCVDDHGAIIDEQIIHSSVFINTSALFDSYHAILDSLIGSIDPRIILDWGFNTDVVAATKLFFGWT